MPEARWWVEGSPFGLLTVKWGYDTLGTRAEVFSFVWMAEPEARLLLAGNSKHSKSVCALFDLSLVKF